jgi:hypothetical protein
MNLSLTNYDIPNCLGLGTGLSIFFTKHQPEQSSHEVHGTALNCVAFKSWGIMITSSQNNYTQTHHLRQSNEQEASK